MAKFGEGGELLKCSFCGKSQKQVKKLIAGPGVYICDECIDLCNEIIEEEFAGTEELDFAELPKPQEILAFLDDLERRRNNSVRRRNLRLTAIRSFMRYVSIRDPASLPVAQRVLAIAGKRFDRPVLEFLSRDEIQALLDAPDRDTWSGHRDTALFAVLYNTGARVSEIIRLQTCDILLDRAYALHLHGKGRKERVIPLWKSTATQLRSWLQCIDHQPKAPVFPNRAGNALSRSGVEHRLRVTIGKASLNCPSLQGRTISPHTLRHYVPFLTMSCNVKNSADMLGNCRLGRAETDPSTRHSFPG